MRRIALLLIVLAAGCQSAPPLPRIAMPASTEAATRAYLLESAAADFREHGPAPSAFRKVRFGYVEGAGGSQMALLCGEFQAAAKPGEWVGFATLRTSKYEQWIGGQGDGFCARPAIGWNPEDLSAELQRRVDAPR